VVLESAPIANNCLNAAKTYEDFVRPALKTRIPEIFKVNGIVVSDVSMQPVRENYQRDAQGNLRLPTLKQVNERYALVMVGRPGGLPMGDCFVKNEDRSIAFTVDANLWDVESGKVLWSASVTFPLVKSKVVSDTDQYIFEVLNLLHTAGYIQFSSGQAIPAPRPSK
jgi:hypothetical protein